MEHKFNADDLFLLEEDTNSTFPLNLEFRKNPHFQINFILKNLFFIITLLISVSSFGQECPTFSFKETLSGNDFVNFNWNPTLKVCEDDKPIEIGSETYYYSRSTRNAYGDFVYIIQEARGYGWPEIGYVKIASNFEIVELKFMNSIVKYRLISTIEKARMEREEQIEREKRHRQYKEEENRKAESDKNEYLKIDILVNEKKYKEAYLKIKSLFFPNKYENFILVKKELKKIDSLYKIEISSNALKKNYNLALQNYDNLNFPDDFLFRLTDWIEMDEKLIVNEFEKRRSKNFEFLVKEYLQFWHSKDTNDLNNSEVMKFLELDKNKNAINKLNQGTHDFLITNTGRIIKDGEDVSNDFKTQSISKFFYKSFEVNINWRFSLEVKDSILNLTKHELSTTKLKPINININNAYKQSSLLIKSKNKQGQLKDLSNEFYFNQNTKDKLTLSTNYKFLDEFDDVGINFNNSVSDKVIEYSELKKKIRFVNNKEFSNLLVYSNFKDFPLIKKSFILKNIVDYSSGVAVLSVVIGGPTWLIIRFLEWSSAKFH